MSPKYVEQPAPPNQFSNMTTVGGGNSLTVAKQATVGRGVWLTQGVIYSVTANGRIQCAFAFMQGPDATYNYIEGNWIDNENLPSMANFAAISVAFIDTINLNAN